MDVYICGNPEKPSSEPDSGNTVDNFLRRRDLRNYYLDTDSIATSMYAHPDVQLRYLIKQSGVHFSGLDELNFEGDFTWPAQLNGRDDGKDALNGANGANVKEFFHEWNRDQAVRDTYPKVGDYIHARATEVRAQNAL
mmetsp:Transcript_31468/g.41669  ORF Transcript_31468/g.41669 Transcript_31468/m.41669 type:complete len:138 (-) Transcript_31468:135-548(-)